MEIFITDEAKEQFRYWKKSGNKKSIQKIDNLLESISNSPYKGIGHPKPLCDDYAGCWSRKIDGKNRIVYRVDETKGVIYIYSVLGHYQRRVE
ncbi:MAG TPA: Txe/YoeB family addiction module toxin [Bacteroidales bacterium]|jgi:toxin YoeB|nr:Txe/YoeB family addiction module toxin [Bacteroidales bacterium]HOS17482.1 Txe/YoeB family addiction module toxin [Bacteroidales bacterium]